MAVATAERATESADALLDRLGASLIEGGVIDQRTLDRARRAASETSTRLDRILTQLGLVSERSLAETLAQLLSLPVATAADYPQEPLFVDRLKPKFLRHVRAMPIAMDNDRVTLAMADPLELVYRECGGGGAGPADRSRRRCSAGARRGIRPALRRSRGR